MIRAVFFDLDGTLCDPGDSWNLGVEAAFDLFETRHPGCRDALAAAWQDANANLRGRLDRGELRMRDVVEGRFPLALEGIGIEDDALAEELNDVLSRTRRGALKPMEGAHDLLRALSDRYAVGIITNGSDANAVDSQPSTARHIGVLDLVGSIWVSDAVGFRKPDPGIFQAALAGAGVEPDQAVYVGDSPRHDVAGAVAAGMRSILICPSGTPDGPLPDAVVRSLRDVVPAIESLD